MSKNILIVDDSALMRWVLSDIIETDGRYRVYAQVSDGLAAMEQLINADGKIDVVILDINMPKMNGIEVMDKINELKLDVKVIVASTLTSEGGRVTVTVLEKGAFDFIKKPDSFTQIKEGSFRNKLLKAIELALESKNTHKSLNTNHNKKTVNKKNQDNASKQGQALPKPVPNIASSSEKNNTVGTTITRSMSTHRGTKNERKLVFIATSTGGPNALHEVIPKIDKRIDAPIVVVQHMPKDFTKYLAERLDVLSTLKVKEASQDEILKKGEVYIAPGGFQLILEEAGKDVKCNIYRNDRLVLNPCADETLISMKRLPYDRIICVVLTGMGKDGTDGVAELSKFKELSVIAQDEETCVVYGMPKMVTKTGLVNEVVSLTDVAKTIINYTGVR